MRKKRISKFTVLLLTLILVFGVSAQSTIAYLMAETQQVVNTFKPVKTSEYDFDLSVTGTKELKGRDWKAGDSFNFVLQIKQDDPGTTEKEKWSWAGNTAVTAEGEVFDLSEVVWQYITREGAHEFRLYEVPGDEKGMTYDDTVYQMLIVVEEDTADNSLFIDSVSVAETDLENDAGTFTSVNEDGNGVFNVVASFVNEYDEPDKPSEPSEPSDPSQPSDPSEPPTDPSQPTEPSDEPTDSSDEVDRPTEDTGDEESKTGDDSNVILPFVLMIASGAIIAVLLVDRRRRRA